MKTESKHTPGPWEVTNADKDTITVSKRGVFTVAALWSSTQPRYEQEANALLISQAPALLDALKDIHDRLLGLKHFGPMSTNTIEDLLAIAEQAVKKAEEA